MKPSLAKWLMAVAFDWGAVSLSMIAIWLATGWDSPLRFGIYVLATAVVSCRQHALLVLGHESVHRIVCRNKWWNDLLGEVLTFAPCLVSIKTYRDFHLVHHQRLGTDDDPERWGKMVFFPNLGIRYRLPYSRARFWTEVALCLTGARSYVAAVYIASFTPRTAGGWLLLAVEWSAIMAVLWLTGAWWILAVWALAFATMTWAAIWFRIWCEHSEIGETYRLSWSWWQRFLLSPHNIGLHYEHHASSQVPFWGLPKLRKSLTGPSPIPLRSLMTLFD